MMHLELYVNGKLLDKAVTYRQEINFQKARLKLKWRSRIKSAKSWTLLLTCPSKINKLHF